MDLLQQLITIFAENGYVAVFIALMICGAGLPLPEDITLVAGGVIAGLGYANVHAMFALTMFGVLLGDCAIFLLGHHYGARMLKWRFVARILTPSRYAMVQQNSPATATACCSSDASCPACAPPSTSLPA
jgi:Uncharacterized membrane-associated protein